MFYVYEFVSIQHLFLSIFKIFRATESILVVYFLFDAILNIARTIAQPFIFLVIGS